MHSTVVRRFQGFWEIFGRNEKKKSSWGNQTMKDDVDSTRHGFLDNIC